MSRFDSHLVFPSSTVVEIVGHAVASPALHLSELMNIITSKCNTDTMKSLLLSSCHRGFDGHGLCICAKGDYDDSFVFNIHSGIRLKIDLTWSSRENVGTLVPQLLTILCRTLSFHQLRAVFLDFPASRLSESFWDSIFTAFKNTERLRVTCDNLHSLLSALAELTPGLQEGMLFPKVLPKLRVLQLLLADLTTHSNAQAVESLAQRRNRITRSYLNGSTECSINEWQLIGCAIGKATLDEIKSNASNVIMLGGMLVMTDLEDLLSMAP